MLYIKGTGNAGKILKEPPAVKMRVWPTTHLWSVPIRMTARDTGLTIHLHVSGQVKNFKSFFNKTPCSHC
jgi:hypothetical protein